MEDASSQQPTCIYYADAVIAILILISGLLVCIVGVDYLASVFLMGSRGYSISVPASVGASGVLILTIGLATVVYGLKRLISNVVRAMKSNLNLYAGGGLK